MSQKRTIQEGAWTVHFTAYTRDEIKRMWTQEGQGHRQAASDVYPYCVYVACTEAEAIDISAMFIRHIFAIPTCTHFNGHRLALYHGDGGSQDQVRLRMRTLRMVSEYLQDHKVPDDLFAES